MEEKLNNKNDIPLAGYIREYYDIPKADIKTYSPLTLAFIGDAVYDIVLRTVVVEKGNAPVNTLHKKVAKKVNAAAQADLFHKIENQLSKEEMSVFRRGRNAKAFNTAKNASVKEYRTATGLEALIGYLYLTDQTERILEIIKLGLIH